MMVTSPSTCGFCHRTYRRGVHWCFASMGLASLSTWTHRAMAACDHALQVAEREHTMASMLQVPAIEAMILEARAKGILAKLGGRATR